MPGVASLLAGAGAGPGWEAPAFTLSTKGGGFGCAAQATCIRLPTKGN